MVRQAGGLGKEVEVTHGKVELDVVSFQLNVDLAPEV
jgi:hypothetical protein